MLDADRRASRAESGFKLHLAARVGGDDELRAGARHVVQLLVEDASGHRRLERAVQTRGAAADVGVLHLDELDTRYRPNEVARLCADSLSVREVARILIRDAHVDRTLRSRQTDLDEPLSQILHAPFELR